MTTREMIIAVIESHGFKKDRFGHWQRTKETSEGVSRTYRYKLSDRSVRKEVKMKFEDGHNEWLRLSSGYYKNLKIDVNLNRIVGMKA